MNSFTLITGASSGIGEEFARELAKKNHSLILVARSKEKLRDLAKELKDKNGIEVIVIEHDLSTSDSAESLFEKCRKFNVNYLINDAGIGLIGNFGRHEIHKINEMLTLNVITLTKLCYLFLPQLVKNNGVLLNVASQAAFSPTAYMAAYGATKAFVLNLTEALRVEYQSKSVTITSLCPGPTYTKFFTRANTNYHRIRFKFRTPQEVVSYALKGVKKKKNIIVPGFENRFMIFMNRFYPRKLLANMSQYMVKKDESARIPSSKKS